MKLSINSSEWGEGPRPCRLAAGVELLAGPNGLPLLYVGERQSYLRVSDLGAEIVSLITRHPALTHRDLSQALAARYPGSLDEVQRQVTQFLRQLDEAGVFESGGARTPDGQGSGIGQLLRRAARCPRAKFAVWRPDRPLVAGLTLAVRGRLIKAAAAAWALVTVIAVGCALTRFGRGIDYQFISWPLVLGSLALHTAGHELSHALVSSSFGVKIRELGVALLYYFIPSAYVDRTDAYRLRQFKPRAYIALAGPAFDLSAAGLSALLALTNSGMVSASFHLLMLAQLIFCFSNLNPLMPSDGYHALEAGFGALNFRQRAFSLLFRSVTGRELPPHLRALTARQQTLHMIYAVVSSIYLFLLACLLIGAGAAVAAAQLGR